jgi:hypothetical protein
MHRRTHVTQVTLELNVLRRELAPSIEKRSLLLVEEDQLVSPPGELPTQIEMTELRARGPLEGTPRQGDNSHARPVLVGLAPVTGSTVMPLGTVSKSSNFLKSSAGVPDQSR